MIQLPATYHGAIEIEAKSFARQWLARMREEGDFIGLGHAPLDPMTGRALSRRVLKSFALTGDTQMFYLTEAASVGDTDAHLVCVELITECTNRGEALPAFLANYNAKIVHGTLPQRLRARKKATNLVQDIVFCALIMELMARFSLRPTRDQKYRTRLSACSVVADVARDLSLHRGGERAIQKIWGRYKDALLPGWLGRPSYIPL
jgi:hypothetical protein